MRAYESRTEPYPVIAARFEIGPATLMRWVQRQRETGTVDPLAKAGGWVSPVAWAVLKPLIDAKPDQTCEWPARCFIPVRMRVYITADGTDLDSDGGGIARR